MSTIAKGTIRDRLARARSRPPEPERRTRVAIVIEATVGGTREHLRQIARRINLRRFEVTVFCSTLRDPGFNRDVEQMRKWGLKVVTLPMQREIRPAQDFMAFLSLCWHFGRRPYDAIHTHSSKAGIVGRLAAAVSGVPRIIHTPHTFAFQSPECSGVRAAFYRFVERYAGVYTTKLVLLSEEQRRRALEEKLAYPDRMSVIPNGVPIRTPEEIRGTALTREALGLGESDLVVGCVGRLTVQKGHEHLIAAAETVCGECPEAVFLLVGDGERRRELEQEVEKRDLRGRVRFLGHREDVLNLYPVFDLLAMTSAYEGMPYVVLEAMASSCPVVAFRLPELEPLVVSGETGYLVPPGNVQELAGHILELRKNPSLRGELSERARAHVEQVYSAEHFIEKIESLYTGGA